MMGPYKTVETPTLLTEKIEHFSSKQIICHRNNIVHFPPKNCLSKNRWTNTPRITPCLRTNYQQRNQRLQDRSLV